MPSYNFNKADSRAEYRAFHVDMFAACDAGTWPRTTDELFAHETRDPESLKRMAANAIVWVDGWVERHAEYAREVPQ